MFIPIFTLNTDKRVWGRDAQEFKYVTLYLPLSPVFFFATAFRADASLILLRPERWETLPPGAQALPGVWGNIMSFLGGARACIGYNFATLE